MTYKKLWLKHNLFLLKSEYHHINCDRNMKIMKNSHKKTHVPSSLLVLQKKQQNTFGHSNLLAESFHRKVNKSYQKSFFLGNKNTKVIGKPFRVNTINRNGQIRAM